MCEVEPMFWNEATGQVLMGLKNFNIWLAVDSEPGRPHKMKATARGSVIHVVWQPPVDKADVCVIKYQLAWGPGAPGRVRKEVDNDTFQYIIGQNPEDKLSKLY